VAQTAGKLRSVKIPIVTKRQSCFTTLEKAVKNSKYYAAFRLLLSRGKAAQQAFDRVVKQRAQQQLMNYMSNKTNRMMHAARAYRTNQSQPKPYPVLNGCKSIQDVIKLY